MSPDRERAIADSERALKALRTDPAASAYWAWVKRRRAKAAS